ncbi:MAG TPA: transcription termination factor Rho [Acidobacteriota bacterium]|nr:transcription termination factor Rho [Acidobacteriota bacterium]HRR56850.1 transcription termination factor Rho [Acidobacteriota bacterium]HRV07862.1 transcription termination factor Rho [Acidobacteriota bacterium]
MTRSNQVRNVRDASGYLDLHDKGYGFLRSLERGFEPHRDDAFVEPSLIRELGLRPGHFVTGLAGDGYRGKSPRLVAIESVDGLPADRCRQLPEFARLTSINPHERLRIDDSGDPSMRILDLIAPIGKGQRALVVAPPRTGKTMLLQKLAQSVAQQHPEIELIILLIDERPEEATEMKRLGVGNVVSSSADMPPQRHVRVAEMILQRARRLVEEGRDVMILLDSITRLARAYNTLHKGSNRTMSGGLGAGVLLKPREFFGSARKLQEGGSLTIVATALVDTGSRMDDVIFEEFKGTGNMELVLSRDLADRRIWPAADITRSGTRREEQLRSAETQSRINLMRRALASLSPEKAMLALLRKIEETQDNRTFLDSLG